MADHLKTHETVGELMAEPTHPEVQSHKQTKRRRSEKNHKCQYCDRAFPTQSLLTTHIRVRNNSSSQYFQIMTELMHRSLAYRNRSIPENDHSNAQPARRHSKRREHLICMRAGIAASSRTGVRCVIVDSLKVATLKFI